MGDPGATANKRPRWRTADRVVTVALLVALSFAAIALTRLGAIVAFPADVCGDGVHSCDYGAISAAGLAASYVPVLLLIAALVLAVHRMHRGRVAVVVPVAGFALVLGVLAAAGQVVDAAITRGG